MAFMKKYIHVAKTIKVSLFNKFKALTVLSSVVIARRKRLGNQRGSRVFLFTC